MTTSDLVVRLLGASLLYGPSTTAFAESPTRSSASDFGSDDLYHPLGDQQRAARSEAHAAVLSGSDTGTGSVKRVANGQYVELEREGEDLIFTILVEFGDTVHPFTGGEEGPLHNEIPEPDRTLDNVNLWREDFNQAHYADLLFSEGSSEPSMRDFYIELSSNRYTVDGDVSDWVGVDYNEALYGSDYCDSIVCGTIWWLIEDGADSWYDSQIAAGMSAADIDEYLSQFDVWDRYDWDGDGNFDEPDGYIDHFQMVHAGMGEEAGGGEQGSDAIWSHRWYVNSNLVGSTGPSAEYPLGGAQIGDSSYWIGDYTIEPENGGVGVFAHEFGHDLGLPDLYDTQGGENSTGFWTLMSSGSWLGEGGDDIGSKPGHMGAWEKLFLGWLDYEVAFAGEKSEHKLGPSTTTTKQAQALVVVLPEKETYGDLGDAYAGDYFFYSGAGDNLQNTMLREFDVDSSSTLTAMVRYDIETDWDYAYLIVVDDSGVHFVDTSESSGTDSYGANYGGGITGSTDGDWVELTASLGDFDGTVLVGFAYVTDGNTGGDGFMVDELEVSGYDVDGAEDDAGWSFDGFSISDANPYYGSFFNAYIAEYRQYDGYDATLETGPYAFIARSPADGVAWVDHFAYQQGLLVSYWDTSQSNNNTSAHPGEGLILPIDAHPDSMTGQRPRYQIYDAPFGLDETDGFAVEYGGSVLFSSDSEDAVSTFDDTEQYWRDSDPLSSVKNPNTGTQIRVKSVSAKGNFMQVEVKPVE